MIDFSRAILYITFLAACLLQAGCGGLTGLARDDARQGLLREQVDGYLAGASVTPPAKGRLMALVLPDSDGPDAAAVAADGYKALEGLQFDTVVLVRQSQGNTFAGATVCPEGDFETPFGAVPVDEALARAFIGHGDSVVFNPQVGCEEYVRGLALGFLRRVIGDFRVVPVLVGQPDQKTYDRLTAVMAAAVTKRRTRVLLVALSDLTKDVPFDLAVKADDRTVAAMSSLGLGKTQKLLISGRAHLTGGHAVLLAMGAARMAGADMAEVFHTITVRDEDDLGSGYVSMGFYDVPLNKGERVELLTLARRSVEAALNDEEYEPDGAMSPLLKRWGAAFVTLEKNHRLRGGMGQVQASGPLYRSVITSARAAALEDTRFPQVSPFELDDLSYEVSVLTPLVPVIYIRDIELGVHGLFMHQKGHSGMLLPQVPVEQGWDLEEYLRQISLRSGLPPDAWKDRASQLWTFTTEIVR